MPQPAAEQEAMAELVMTGKLFDLGAVFRPDLIWLAFSQKDGVEDDE